jgi:hypothetical protein
MKPYKKMYTPVIDLLEECRATSKKGAYMTEPSIRKRLDSGHLSLIRIEKASTAGRIINVGMNLPDMDNCWTLNEDKLGLISSIEPFFRARLSEDYSIDNRIKSPRMSYQALKDALDGRLHMKLLDLKKEASYASKKKQNSNYIHGKYPYDNRKVHIDDDESKEYSSLISTLEILMSLSEGIKPPSRSRIKYMSVQGIPNKWKEIES